MIDLHYWPTPNGKKVTILLEECGMPLSPRSLPHREGRSVRGLVPQYQSQQPYAPRWWTTTRPAAARR